MLFSILLERIAIMALLMAGWRIPEPEGLSLRAGQPGSGCHFAADHHSLRHHQILHHGILSSAAPGAGAFRPAGSDQLCGGKAPFYLVFGQRRRLENFAAAFCNAGFIGIPLVQAVVGQEGVFYIAASVALLNLFQWTYGVYIMTGRKDTISPKAIARNPVVISIVTASRCS